MPPPKRPWFRFYVEAMRDPKLRMLAPAHRWLFVTVLGCARQSPQPGILLVTDSVPMTAELIADEAALPVRETKKGLKALADLNLIEWDNDAWVVTKWKERQFESDETTNRTRKHRSNNGRRNVPSPNDVAPPETETDSEADSPPQTPRRAGGLRANGDNPRARAAERERQRLISLMETCADCGDNPNRLCSKCTGLNRQLAEVAS
jgi:hypothetical protein